MGWGGGTEIFDSIARRIIDTDLSEETKLSILEDQLNVLRDHDWDCEEDSDYFNHPLVKKVFKF